MLFMNNLPNGGKYKEKNGLILTKKSELINTNDRIDKALPYDFRYGGVVVYNGEIHILGTYVDSTTLRKCHYAWKTGDADWHYVSTLPAVFYSNQIAVYNNKIHIITPSTTNSEHYSWDGTSWTAETPPPVAFMGGTALVINDELHILSNTNHYKYDGVSWTSVSILPINCSQRACGIYKGKIYVIDVTSNSSAPYSMYCWDGNSWSCVDTSLTYSPRLIRLIEYNDELHLLGGSTPNDTTHKTWNEVDGWVDLPNLSYPSYQTASVVYNDEIHILGGYPNYLRLHVIIGTTIDKLSWCLTTKENVRVIATLDDYDNTGKVFSDIPYGCSLYIYITKMVLNYCIRMKPLYMIITLDYICFLVTFCNR